jgi:hypothetical protein
MKRPARTLCGMSIVCVLTFLACGRLGKGPEKTLSKYVDAFLHGDYQEAYQYISARDRAVKSLEEYLSEQTSDELPVFEIFSSSISFEIKSVAVNGNLATAEVAMTVPDPGAIMGDLFGAAMASVLAGDDDDQEIGKILKEKYSGKKIPTTTLTNSFDLVKESDGWRVFFDWETQERVSTLITEAKADEKKKDYAAARAKYLEVVKLSGESTELAQKISEMERELKSYKLKQSYMDKIALRNIKVSKTILGERGVFGEIKNLGDRILREVEITVYCLDAKGAIVYEEDYHPVLVSEASLFAMLRDNDPLKPNYSKKFGYSLEDAPSDWAGKVKVKVTDIEFE